MTFTVLTLGCKVNQYESQVMHEALLSAGHTPVALTDRPELCVINTCTVTSVSDGKAMKLLRRTRRENPACVIVLTGCMPQAFPERRDKFSEADIVLGNKCRGELLPAIEKFCRREGRYSKSNRIKMTPLLKVCPFRRFMNEPGPLSK